MERIDRMLIEHECQKLILRYAHLNDAGAWQELADTFTDDATFARPSAPDDIIRGRKDILASFAARDPGHSTHVVTNILVTAESPTMATARSTIQLFLATGPDKPVDEPADDPGDDPQDSWANRVVASHARAAPLIGEFLDRLRLENDQWLFSERRGRVTIR